MHASTCHPSHSQFTAAATAVAVGTDKPPVQLMEDVVLGKVSSS
jgi:hypothetical protein